MSMKPKTQLITIGNLCVGVTKIMATVVRHSVPGCKVLNNRASQSFYNQSINLFGFASQRLDKHDMG
jgi:hypothetical protein